MSLEVQTGSRRTILSVPFYWPKHFRKKTNKQEKLIYVLGEKTDYSS